MSNGRNRDRSRARGGGASAANPLSKWFIDLASVIAGTGNARILCIGDSTMHGSTAGGTNQRPNETKALANLFVANGIKASDDANFGTSDFTTAKRLFKDLRYTGTFSMYSSGSLGGNMGRGTAAGQFLNYAPETVCDTFRVFFWSGGGSSTAFVQATGGAPSATQSMATIGQEFGTTDLRYIDVQAATLTAGNSVTITMVSGTNVPVAAIECWDSTASQVIFVNAGHHGSSSPNWIVEGITSPNRKNPLDILKGFPDGYYSAVYIRPGVNDAGSGNSIEGIYKPNIRTVRNGVGNKSSFIIGAANPISSGLVDPYNVANEELAAELGAAYINSRVDVNFDTYANANAAGHMADGLHPDPSGFELMAGYGYTILNP